MARPLATVPVLIPSARALAAPGDGNGGRRVSVGQPPWLLADGLAGPGWTIGCSGCNVVGVVGIAVGPVSNGVVPQDVPHEVPHEVAHGSHGVQGSQGSHDSYSTYGSASPRTRCHQRRQFWQPANVGSTNSKVRRKASLFMVYDSERGDFPR